MSNDFEIAKSLLATNGKITGLATGRSMWPLLRSNKDNAVITPVTRPFRKNDVVLYRKPTTNELVLHRIIKIHGDKLIIRGDNVYYKETGVKPEDIIGILEGFYKNGKYRECRNNTLYNIYVLYIRLSYPVRFLVKKALSLCKRIINKLKNIAK